MMKIIVYNLIFFLCLVTGINSINAASAIFSITAIISPRPISLAANNGLDFGTIAAQSAEAVTVAPSSGSAAKFTLTGTPKASFSTFISGSSEGSAVTSINLVRTSGEGAATLPINNFRFEGLDTATESGGTGSIDGSGLKTLKIGATAHPSGQEGVGASYTGSLYLVIAEL